jgi:uncharacterized membrane protein YgcG
VSSKESRGEGGLFGSDSLTEDYLLLHGNWVILKMNFSADLKLFHDDLLILPVATNTHGSIKFVLSSSGISCSRSGGGGSHGGGLRLRRRE